MYRPEFGRFLTVFIGVICAAGLLVLTLDRGLDGLLAAGAWLVLPAYVTWALFWRPEVVVDDGGVVLVNVLRTIRLPWPSIQRIDTKWALTLYTAYGTYPAWAAPAPSRRAVRRLTADQAKHLPKSTYGPGGIRPGDLPESPSGQAALTVRRHWESLRDAGYLDDPRLEFTRPPVQWHHGTIAGALVLAALAAAEALL